MEKKDLRERIILELLINKYRNEDVTTDLVKTIENDFYQISGELKEKKGEKKITNVADYFAH
jgi:hypothetical protein